jgi:predicted nucleotidyltransferase component of viral defense system
VKFLVKLIEDKNCYFSQEQRKILVNLFKNETIQNNFFLTGGTALSVFYLHHRKSNDIELFTIQKPEFHEIEYGLKTTGEEVWFD